MGKRYSQKVFEMLRSGPTMVDGSGKPRSLKRLREAAAMLSDLVWYNRYQNRLFNIEQGDIKIVDEETSIESREGRTISREIWEQAQKAARKLEKRYGEENLGPWDDFEWGMINGKLSAIRWALGEEWDNLET